MEGERLGSNLQGEFSTIEFPLRLREKNSCSLILNVPPLASRALCGMDAQLDAVSYKNGQVWHLKGKMKTEEPIHRHTVKCLNYIPVKIICNWKL